MPLLKFPHIVTLQINECRVVPLLEVSRTLEMVHVDVDWLYFVAGCESIHTVVNQKF